MPDTMHAIRLPGPVAPGDMSVTTGPIPLVGPGQVRIRVMAFGVNESEVTSRKGESGPDFSFPRILGIEGVGIVDAVGEGVDLVPGQKVATMMGGLGRAIDGSYAEYTVVTAANAIPFETELGWDVVGVLPETLQTARFDHHRTPTAGRPTRTHSRRHLHRRTHRNRNRASPRRHSDRNHPESGAVRHSRRSGRGPHAD